MVKMTQEGINMFIPELDRAVIQLHDIARTIENNRNIGPGQLSQDVRAAADKLNEILNALL
ncbi:hypothetical protein UFOVP190_279 [uncultured Caudovirales phage]|uniref:Uncharacterized protein n=1 Tax=uncultured Caudovirales phage TaxID=2100421 RepID=A0A6J7WGS6_9CAUD|nr:hypothetical protein UFOVP190_279 [uncultured Caudovirales phage]